MKRIGLHAVTGFVASACVIAALPGHLRAQTRDADATLRFEVASIRLNTDAVRPVVGIQDGQSLVQITALPLRQLIRMAYRVREAVGPGWLDDVRFDIAAKPPAGYESRQLAVLLRNPFQ